MMFHIYLPDNQFALVDTTAHTSNVWRVNHQGYVVRSAYQPRGMPRTIYLHREVAGAGVGDVVRHRDGNKLDCRFDNLEIIRKGS